MSCRWEPCSNRLVVRRDIIPALSSKEEKGRIFLVVVIVIAIVVVFVIVVVIVIIITLVIIIIMQHCWREMMLVMLAVIATMMIMIRAGGLFPPAWFGPGHTSPRFLWARQASRDYLKPGQSRSASARWERRGDLLEGDHPENWRATIPKTGGRLTRYRAAV